MSRDAPVASGDAPDSPPLIRIKPLQGCLQLGDAAVIVGQREHHDGRLMALKSTDVPSRVTRQFMTAVQSKIRTIFGGGASRLTTDVDTPVRSVSVPPRVADDGGRRELRSAATQLRELAASKARLEGRLAQCHSELSAVVRLLHESELVQQRQKSDIDWLIAVGALLANRPKWWFMLVPPIQTILLHRRVRRRALFDRDRYVARYPDVLSAGQDPLGHYIRHGLREGRVNDLRS